jgi:hypothetical protein
MSNPNPPDGGTETASIQSSIPNAPATITAVYKTTTSSYGGTTDGSGNASITFGIGDPTVGFAVIVSANVGNGAASCSTSFTPTP